MPVKVRLVRDGTDLAQVACTHFVYLHPDYWGRGVTMALTDQARRSSPDFTHTLLHGFATKEFEDWAANLDGVVEVAVKNGARVYVREIG